MAEKVTNIFMAYVVGGQGGFEIEEFCELTLEHVPAQDASRDPFTNKQRPARAAQTREILGKPSFRLKGTTTPVTSNIDGTFQFVNSDGTQVVLTTRK